MVQINLEVKTSLEQTKLYDALKNSLVGVNSVQLVNDSSGHPVTGLFVRLELKS
jgi:hypothetical protein